MFLCHYLVLYAIFVVGTAEEPPNFVFVLTDDQDLILNGLIPMQKTLKLVANHGMTFENFFVNSPICCPSRSTILTGLYAHNTGVKNNSINGNCSSTTWQRAHEPFSIASILKRSKNYTTFYAGKYLNQYGSKESSGTRHVPKGYDWWLGLKGNSKYYNYTLSINGSSKHFEDQYLTDVIANYSINFLDLQGHNPNPFFIMLSPPASHAPFTPANRHSKKFPNTKVVRTPSFNFTSKHKHWIVGMKPTSLPSNVTILDDIQRHRLQSLLAVDDMVEIIVNKLKQIKKLKNTYIIFTSDNGYHIGQFAQPWDKRQPYETDIRVPFFISGPKIPKKWVNSYPISAVDIAPSILDLANVTVLEFMDGTSFKNRLFSKKEAPFNEYILVEYWGEGSTETVDERCQLENDGSISECSVDQWCKCQDSKNNTYSCVLSISNAESIKFCQFEDDKEFVEVYNLTSDPFELNNIIEALDSKTVESCKAELDRLQTCIGKSCSLPINSGAAYIKM